ncbi:MAG: sensor histidine kinase [Bacteroidota bacterium]|nr:sensor histidine kinase [Bacteroidota bacterium]
MKRVKIYLLVFLLSIGNTFSQVDHIKFLKEFKAADRKGKVKLVASVDFCNLKDIYPQLKDTLDLIRRKIFTNSSSKEAKFLFDKIDVSMYVCNKQFSKAAILVESSLSSHVRDIYDSLYCYIQLKEAFINLNNLNKAIEANTMYDKLATRSKEKKYLNQITKKSRIYDAFGLNRQAVIEKRREFIEEYPLRKHDTDFVAGYLNDVGVYFNRMKMSDSAIPYFVRATELITKKLSYSPNKPNYQFFKGLIEGNMAFAYTNKGEYKKALPYLKTDIYYSKRVNDMESAFNSSILLSRCYIKLQQLHFAQQYADSAEQISLAYTQPRIQLKLLYLQGELMDALGNASQAVNKFKAYMSLKDSISNRDKELQLINQQVALDIQKKELELSEKSELIKNSLINEGKQKVFRAYLMAGLIITIILIGFLFYTNNNSKRREEELEIKNQQIQIQNKQIETSLNEKELLLREIHHRVKNNLQIINSVINLQSDKTQNVELNEVLSELKGRISSIALTHQMLYQRGTSSSVVLCEYLQNLIAQIYTSYENEHIKVNFNCNNKEFIINIDTAIPLGLLVNEIMTNAFKHAFKKTHALPAGKKEGIIQVDANVSLKQVELTIKDNGVGLPDNYNDMMNKPSSLGFELIAILVEQIDAKLEIKNNDGACFVLNFKA